MLDTTSLYLHVLAATALVGGGLAQVLAGFRVRAAATGHELASWARFTRQSGLLIAAAAVVSLMTGGHLAGAVWTSETVSGFSYPFITIGTAGLVLLAPVGPMIGGARLRRLATAADDLAAGPVLGDLRASATAASLWGPVHSLVGVGAGLVALMVYKPGSWLLAGVVLLVTFALGWGAGVLIAKPLSA